MISLKYIMWSKNNILFLLSLSLLGCSENREQPSNAFEINFPENYGEPSILPENLPTEAGIELGRHLFYDPILSVDGSISCASCHKQSLGFGDEKSPSVGVSGKLLERNSPTLINLAWHNGFFWEGGSVNLESQVLGPLTHEDEMGNSMNVAIERVKQNSTYKKLIYEAFGDSIVNSKHIMWSIAQFEYSLISNNTKYDQWIKGQADFSALEKAGKALFESHCESCHQYPLFTDISYHNNGLDHTLHFNDVEDPKWGRYRVTFHPDDKGKYKTPTLRNCNVSAPYMHDGRYATLEDVINYYSDSIKASPTLNERLPIGGFHFNLTEKEALLAFLVSLEDQTMNTNPAFESPFK